MPANEKLSNSFGIFFSSLDVPLEPFQLQLCVDLLLLDGLQPGAVEQMKLLSGFLQGQLGSLDVGERHHVLGNLVVAQLERVLSQTFAKF